MLFLIIISSVWGTLNIQPNLETWQPTGPCFELLLAVGYTGQHGCIFFILMLF